MNGVVGSTRRHRVASVIARVAFASTSPTEAMAPGFNATPSTVISTTPSSSSIVTSPSPDPNPDDATIATLSVQSRRASPSDAIVSGVRVVSPSSAFVGGFFFIFFSLSLSSPSARSSSSFAKRTFAGASLTSSA